MSEIPHRVGEARLDAWWSDPTVLIIQKPPLTALETRGSTIPGGVYFDAHKGFRISATRASLGMKH